MKKFDLYNYRNIQKTSFNPGDKVNIKSEFLLGLYKTGIYLGKIDNNPTKCKVKFDKNNMIENVSISRISDVDSAFGISFVPYKDESDFETLNLPEKFNIFSVMYITEDIWDDVVFYFYIFTNHELNQWCFIEVTDSDVSFKTDLKYESIVLDCKKDSLINHNFKKIFKKYFGEQFSVDDDLVLQDENILNIIGKLKNPIVRIPENEYNNGRWVYPNYVFEPRSKKNEISENI